MTKKSAARLERDRNAKEMAEMKKNNTCWDELQQLSRQFSEAIVSANAQLNDIYRTPNLINFIPMKAEVAVALKGLAQDIGLFTSELAGIYAQHKDRFGGFTDESDFMVSIGIFEQYTNYQTKYDSTIMPTVIFLLEQAELALAAGTAQQKTEEEIAAENLLDPNVVSDVEVK